jgi:hypothetical protein
MSKNTTTTAPATTTTTDEVKVLNVTTMNVSIDVRDTLNAYREEMGFKSLTDAMQYLLIQAGYDMPLPRLVAGLEWADEDATDQAA